MNRYRFNFIGKDGKTFSDSLPQKEYHTPEIIQREKHRPSPVVFERILSFKEMASFITEVENYRAKFYRTPKMHSWDADRVIYVHPSITDERALEIIKKVFG